MLMEDDMENSFEEIGAGRHIARDQFVNGTLLIISLPDTSFWVAQWRSNKERTAKGHRHDNGQANFVTVCGDIMSPSNENQGSTGGQV